MRASSHQRSLWRQRAERSTLEQLQQPQMQPQMQQHMLQMQQQMLQMQQYVTAAETELHAVNDETFTLISANNAEENDKIEQLKAKAAGLHSQIEQYKQRLRAAPMQNQVDLCIFDRAASADTIESARHPPRVAAAAARAASADPLRAPFPKAQYDQLVQQQHHHHQAGRGLLPGMDPRLV